MPRTAQARSPAATDDDADDAPVVHRQTSAAITGIGKPPGAVCSVFDNGVTLPDASPARPPRAPYQQHPRLDAAAVIVRKGVPIPPAARGGNYKNSQYAAVLAKMKPGDSVELLMRHGTSLVQLGNKRGVKLVVRKLTAETCGVWRLS